MSRSLDNTQIAACAAAYIVIVGGDYLKKKKRNPARKEDIGCMKFTKVGPGKYMLM